MLNRVLQESKIQVEAELVDKRAKAAQMRNFQAQATDVQFKLEMTEKQAASAAKEFKEEKDRLEHERDTFKVCYDAEAKAHADQGKVAFEQDETIERLRDEAKVLTSAAEACNKELQLQVSDHALSSSMGAQHPAHDVHGYNTIPSPPFLPCFLQPSTFVSKRSTMYMFSTADPDTYCINVF